MSRRRRTETPQGNDGSIRRIPEADVSGFTPPRLIHSKPFPNADVSLIRSLQGELISSGVIASDVAMSEDTEQSLEELIEVLKEANAHAQSEKDFNPEHYDEESMEELDREEAGRFGKDYENEMLDGLDDYGNRVYDDEQEQVQEGLFPHPVQSQVPDEDTASEESESTSVQMEVGRDDRTSSEEIVESGRKVRVRLSDGTEIVGEIV